MRPFDPARPDIPENLLPEGATGSERKPYIPKLDMDQIEMEGVNDQDPDILEFVDSVCNDDDPLRRAYLFDCARNIRMFRGLHWFDEQSSYRLTTAENGFAFEYLSRQDFGDDRPLPLPTTNLTAEAVANETNRIGRKEYEPSITSRGASPKHQQAAKLSQQITEYDMVSMGWDETRREIEAEYVLCGMAVGKSYLDEVLTDGDVEMVADCQLCDACQCVSSSKLDPDGQPIEVCPACQSGPMRLVQMPDDDMDKDDYFGRPLGKLVPRVEAKIAHISVADMFYENGGLKVGPKTCRIFGQASAVDIDHVIERWPEAADWLEPEAPEQIMRHDLVLGDMMRLAMAQGRTIFPNHVRLREVHILPRLGMPKGASFWVAGDRVLGGKKLVKEFEAAGRKHSIHLVKYGVARMRSIPNVMYGRTPVSDVVPLNRRYNLIDLIEEEIQHKGYPVLVQPAGTTFTPRRDGPFAVVEVETADDNPQRSLKDLMVATPAQTGAEYEAIKAGLEQKIQRLMGPAPIEGTGAMGPQTATGLQLMVEQREQARGPSEARLKDGIFVPLWSHHLGLLAAFDTVGEVMVQRGASSFALQSYKGSDLAEVGLDFSLEAKGNFDRTLFQREGVTQGMNLGLYDVTNDATKSKILEVMGLPDIPSAKSEQIKLAESAWQSWMDDLGEGEDGEEEVSEGEDGEEEGSEGQMVAQEIPAVPVFDPITNDPGVWFAVLGEAWIREEFRQILARTQWDALLPMIAGWPDRLEQAEMLDAQQRSVYGGVPPEQWDAYYEQSKQRAMQQAQEAAKMQAEATEAGQQAPPTQPPQQVPPPPQSGRFLPDPMEERIIAIWSVMCGGAVPVSAARLLPMYALICACWVRAKRRAESMQQQAAPVAPGQGGGAA